MSIPPPPDIIEMQANVLWKYFTWICYNVVGHDRQYLVIKKHHVLLSSHIRKINVTECKYLDHRYVNSCVAIIIATCLDVVEGLFVVGFGGVSYQQRYCSVKNIVCLPKSILATCTFSDFYFSGIWCTCNLNTPVLFW